MLLESQLDDGALTPGIGHNGAPPPTPFEAARDEIESLHGEARLWLDGATVDSAELAGGISNLLNLIRAAEKKADDARKVEAKPFDDGKAEVQARYNPLLAKAKQATAACKAALAPWLAKLEAEKAAKAAEARRIADQKAAEAQAAIRAASGANLAEKEAAEAKLSAAKAAAKIATRAENDKAQSDGGVGRAVSLRTEWRAEIEDVTLAARHYWGTDRPAIEGFLLNLAARDVRLGKRAIPGVAIREHKTVV